MRERGWRSEGIQPPFRPSLCSDPSVDVAHFKEHGAHVLVGTPGRIDDIMKRCTTMDFKRLEVCGGEGGGEQ